MKNSFLKKGLALLLSIAMCCALFTACGNGNTANNGTAGEENGEETYTLQLAWGTADSEYDPFAIAAHTLQEVVTEKTNGRITFEFFPNSVLGAERDTFEGVSMGTIDTGLINNTPIGGFVPQCQVLDMPYLFPDKETIWEIVDGELGAQVDKCMLDSYSVMSLGVFDGGFRHMYNNVRPIYTPDDMNGLTMRSMENTVYLEMFKALGANPTAMAFTEIFTGLQQKTVDGFEIGMAVYYTNNFHEVTKYMSLTSHTFTPIRFIIGADKFNSLPADLQQLLQESVDEAEQLQRERYAAKETEMLGMIKDAGVEINEVTDIAQFSEKCKDIWGLFEDQIGSDLLNSVIDICTKQ